VHGLFLNRKRSIAHADAYAENTTPVAAPGYDGASGRAGTGGACGERSGALTSVIARSGGASAITGGSVKAGNSGAVKSCDSRWHARIDALPFGSGS
jgi:hypothetical protein